LLDSLDFAVGCFPPLLDVLADEEGRVVFGCVADGLLVFCFLASVAALLGRAEG